MIGTVLMWIAVVVFGLSGAVRIVEGKRLLGLARVLPAAANAILLKAANR